MQSICKKAPYRVLGWILSLLCVLAPLGAWGADDGEWEWRSHAGARIETPKDWQIQNRDPTSIVYARHDEAAGHMTLFAYGWEKDPGAVRKELEGEGLAFRDIGERTVAGIAFKEHEMSAPAGMTQPTWLRQLIAVEPRPDGRYLMIQFGVVGTDDHRPFLPTLERMLNSLGGAPEPTTVAAPTGGDETSPAMDQNTLARQIFNEIIGLDDQDLAGIESRYLRLVNECPDTDQAQESYWRLSNLYIQAHDPPRRADAIALLERYRTRYPGSAYIDERFPMFAQPGLSIVENRLLTLYQEEEQWEKALPIYQQVLANPQDVTAERLPYVLGYADVLEKLGRNADAITWYQVYVDRAPDPDDLLVGLARTAIERLTGTVAPPEAAPPASPAAAGGDVAPISPPISPPVSPPISPQATPPVTGAQTAPGTASDAAALATEGRDRLAAGDYAGALERFRASLALQPDPKVQERVKKLEAYLGAGPAVAPGSK